ncbi:DUF488 domain-containing protein [Streptomyces sp. NBC_01190]|uniref:DUF488 domain-containing protein n=1 Tax=Streptomyces sp. NBC_01190 TaxID=2903767 RepID=UPI0038633463|nr:DUF488 family protein [Streptomyces sp. NBC_01190]
MRRVYDPPEPADGLRVLVDRLWPRGLAKDRAELDAWAKELTPSAEARSWYHAHPDRYADFADRYRAELAAADPSAEQTADRLRTQAAAGRVTLLTAVKDEEHSHIPILLTYLTD